MSQTTGEKEGTSIYIPTLENISLDVRPLEILISLRILSIWLVSSLSA